jgi:hypothetical protein
MSTTSDYAGRSYDLVAWQGIGGPAPVGRVVRLRPQLADPGAGGTIVMGVVKMAQRSTLLLLTERGSLKYADVGTRFMADARLGRWRTTFDVQQAFYAALVDVRRQSARIEATADPDDERLADGELLSVGLAGDRVELTVKWTSRAGAAAVMVAPIATVVK